jgi:hypothetical protein
MSKASVDDLSGKQNKFGNAGNGIPDKKNDYKLGATKRTEFNVSSNTIR